MCEKCEKEMLKIHKIFKSRLDIATQEKRVEWLQDCVYAGVSGVTQVSVDMAKSKLRELKACRA